MIDLSKAKSELSPCITLVVKWLEDNGFSGKLTVYNTNKTVFEVSKDGVTDSLEITVGREKANSIDNYLSQFLKSFERKCENERLKQELREKGIL